MPLKALSIMLFGLSIAACTSGMSSTAPSTLALAGNWRTTVTVNGQAAGLTWELIQSGTAVSGPATIALASGTVLMNGFLTGTTSNATATGATLSYAVSVGPGGIPQKPTCTGQFGGTMTATAAVTTAMTGDFTVLSSTCTPPFTSGNLTLTRQ